MLKIFLVVAIPFLLFGIENLSPTKIFHTSEAVQTMVVDDGKLYAGTNGGAVEIFDTQTGEKIKTIQLPNIIDFIGDEIGAKIYSIDKIDEKLLIVSQGLQGYREIFVYKNDQLLKVLGIERKYMIQKASFVSKNEIIYGLLSNQIGLYDTEKEKENYLIQMSMSSFSHFMLNEEKTKIATTDESGVVRVVDTKNGDILKQLPAINLDRVYQLDFKQGIILTAGQDRKAVVYENFSSYSLDFDFLLYSCALSPKANLGAIAYNEQNEVLVFDVKSKKYLYNLTGQEATMTQILFVNENELYISSDSSKVNYFNLGEKK